jgi:predicted  nucleic acid-binding Zn-ribbon protein
MTDNAFWAARRAELQDEVDYLREEKHALLAELAERDATIRDLEDELAESKRRHPSNGRP